MPKTERPPVPPTDKVKTTSPRTERRATASFSDVGARPNQQDACRIWEDPVTGVVFIVVCDGVGGSRSGGEASTLVIQTAAQLWKDRGGVFPDPKRDLISLASVAHQRIGDLADDGEKRAPASTVVALYFTPTEAHWIHAGDSRLYHFRDGQLVSKTRDHSVVQILVDQGEVREEDMGTHPDQGRLLQSLGTREYREPAYGTVPVDASDAFLLCTDGFWERTAPRQIADLLAGDPRHLAGSLRQAVHRAVQVNGPSGDNVTAALVAPLCRPASAPSSFTLKPYFPVLIAGAVALAVVLLARYGWKAAKPPAKPDRTGNAVAGSHGRDGVLKDSGGETVSTIAAPKVGDVKDLVAPAPGNAAPLVEAPPAPEMKVSHKVVPPADLSSPFEGLFGMKFWQVSFDAGRIYVAETEVTEEQWRKISPDDQTGNELLPKNNVTYLQAEEYAGKLTARHRNDPAKPLEESWIYRLPTVREWIRAAGSSWRQYPNSWGDNTRPPNFGNFGRGSGRLPVATTGDAGLPDTKLRDICGNVSEIVTVSVGLKTCAAVGSNYKSKEEPNLHELETSLIPVSFDGLKAEDTIGFRLVLVQGALRAAEAVDEKGAPNQPKPPRDPPLKPGAQPKEPQAGVNPSGHSGGEKSNRIR